jgi:hypothetical protein
MLRAERLLVLAAAVDEALGAFDVTPMSAGGH